MKDNGTKVNELSQKYQRLFNENTQTKTILECLVILKWLEPDRVDKFSISSIGVWISVLQELYVFRCTALFASAYFYVYIYYSNDWRYVMATFSI